MTPSYRPRTGAWRASLAGIAPIAAATLALAVALGSSNPPVDMLVPRGVLRKAAEAERTVARAEKVIADARRVEGVPSDLDDGTARSSLLGGELTPLTTTLGSAEAKRISTDPRWAGALVVRLYRAGLRPGDVVAAGFSGSFPGLNLAVVAACEALRLPIFAISSVTASNYGANQPGFTWPEIERRLVRAGVIGQASVAVSAGGAGDRALDLDAGGRSEADRIAAAVARDAGLRVLAPTDFARAVTERFEVYGRAVAGRPVRLYVNVGGTEPSLGRSDAVLKLRNGFLPGVPFDFSPGRGMMARYAERGVPVLTLLNVRDLAARWGIL
ncbi:MAG: poly-gamma-glutamate system protein [Bacteroidales bacterium]